MKKLVSSGRLFAFGFIVAALLALCVGTLYKLQIIEGAAYYEESQENQSSLQTVTASRGNVLDRYGRTLVSNRECYNLKISDTRLFSDEIEDPNSLILEMVNMIEAAGESYTDDLPITDEPPFEYTNMTENQQTLLRAYLKGKGLDEDTTAVELMSYFRTRYDIANSYTAEEMRKIAGVRYAINVRYEINTNSYVFVEDASIDLISDLMGAVGNVVEVETSYIREYSTQYAAHILGYVNSISEDELDIYRPGKENSGYDYDTKVGKDGIEYICEKWLHGTNGLATVTRTSSGTVTSTIYEKDPVPGNHVYLTIDIELQEAVERALESGIHKLQLARDEENAEAVANGKPDDVKEEIQGGSIVVVDVKTGEPLAMASYPTYDLSMITDPEYYTAVLEADYTPLYNRATMGTYEPGSTFKPCTAIAGLSENIINTETTILCDGVFTKYESQGYAPECWIYTQNDFTHGYDNVTKAIMDSCNIFFYTLADEMGIRTLMEYAKNFGLGESTGIELPEATGNMANPDTHLQYDVDQWYDGDTVQAGIGQSDSVFTPLQLANYIATLVGGGQHYEAHLLKNVKSYDNSSVIYAYDKAPLNTVEMSGSTVQAVKEGMHNLTTGSLSYYFSNCVVSAGAKTGTAETGIANTNNGVFVCFAPYDDPQIAVAVVIEKGGSGAALASTAVDIVNSYFSQEEIGAVVIGENTLLK
jgi:penicillin-binding protein 2